MPEDYEPSSLPDDAEAPRTELRSFQQSQLIACPACRRINPPTRPSCLYCGAQLPLAATDLGTIKPTLRQLEKWEQGFNVILLPGQSAPASDACGRIADLLRLSTEQVKRIMEAGVPLPLARAATLQEASIVEKQLALLDLRTRIVPDSELDQHPPKRLRTVEFKDDALVVYPAGSQGAERVLWTDIVLLVVGRRIVRRLEIAERPGKKREKELVNSRELSADEMRLDIYGQRDEDGWRIASDNFDFSCLGERKSLVSAENFQTLRETLRERASRAAYDETYLRVRYELSAVWPLEEQTESLGLRKQRIGRMNMEAAKTSDNDMQLTRYSRLLHQLKLHERER